MEILRVLTLFRNYLWLIVMAGLVAGIAGFILADRRPDLYVAETSLIVLHNADHYNEDYYYASLADQQLAFSYVELMRVGPVIDMTSSRLGYPVFESNISISSDIDSQIIRVTVVDGNADKAADIANTHVDAFIEFNESIQLGRFKQSEEVLNNQISEVENKLLVVEQSLDELLGQSIDEQQAHIEGLIELAKQEISTLEGSIQNLREQEQNEQTRFLLNDQEVDLRLWQSSLEVYLQFYVGIVVQGEGQFSDSTRLRVEQLTADQALFQTLYGELISSRESIRLAQIEAAPQLVQIEPAIPALTPLGGSPIWLLASLIGIMMSIGLILLLDHFDNTFKTPQDIEAALGLPTLGIVLENVALSTKYDTPLLVRQPRAPESEEFRKIRANLSFTLVDLETPTLLITSTSEGEGKSTLASNLAIAHAHNGKRVLLIDADMRRPTIHSFFGKTRRLGLSNVINHSLSFEDALVETEIDNLSLMTAGDTPPNPAELLGSTRFQTFLDEAKQSFDMIVIDAPPLVVSDPVTLAGNVDGILYAIRPGHTREDAVMAALDDLRRTKTPILGIVLSRADHKSIPYLENNPYYREVSYGEVSKETPPGSQQRIHLEDSGPTPAPAAQHISAD